MAYDPKLSKELYRIRTLINGNIWYPTGPDFSKLNTLADDAVLFKIHKVRPLVLRGMINHHVAGMSKKVATIK